MGILGAFWRFARPHTVIGTTISIISVSIMSIGISNLLNPQFYNSTQLIHILYAVLLAIFTSLCMNVYIVGLNQLFDIEIDKINKPNLPIASGEFSVNTATAIVIFTGIISLIIGYIYGTTALFFTLISTGLLGTVYSCPPFRFKGIPLLAAFCVTVVRGVIVQIGFYYHIQTILQQYLPKFANHSQFPVPLIFASVFIIIFGIVIALHKDLPDMEGDAKYGIRSFTVRMGQTRVFNICVNMLLFDYILGIITGILSESYYSKWITIISHSVLFIITYLRSTRVETTNQKSLTKFYMFIWKLFYVQYLVFPFVK